MDTKEEDITIFSYHLLKYHILFLSSYFLTIFLNIIFFSYLLIFLPFSYILIYNFLIWYRSWCSLNKRSCLAKKARVRWKPGTRLHYPEQIQQLAKVVYSLHCRSCQIAHNSSIDSAFTKPWILDNGATDHIASNSQLFAHTSSSFIPNVNLPIGSTATISYMGTIKFNDNITLKDVLVCVPSFNLNKVY